jgi:hypothetical protein
VYEDEDGNEHRMEIVKVSERIGNFRKCVPRLSCFGAWILCIINVLLPGIGIEANSFNMSGNRRALFQHKFRGTPFLLAA